MRSRSKQIFLFPIFFFFSLSSNGSFLSFLSFLGLVIPFFAVLFQAFFLSLHLSKTVPCFWMGLKLAILERVLNGNLSKPVLRHFANCSSPFLKFFLVFLLPVFLSNNEKQETRTASVLKGYILASV